MSLALPDSSVRCKRHESAMNSVMNTVLGRGSAMSANVRAMKDALMPVRLHRSNSLRIAWVLPIESQERAGLWKLIGSEIPSKGRQALAQLLSVAPVAMITKTAEPLETVGLADHGARPHDLPSLTPGVAGGTDLIQPAKGRGKVFTLG